MPQRTEGTPEQHGEFDEQGVHVGIAMNALRRIVRAVRTTLPSTRGYRNLSGTQLFVLQQIGAAPGQSLLDLCKRTLTSASSTSEVVARLIHGGFVRRSTSEADQRRASFSLTAEGEKAIAGAPESVQEQLISAFQALGPNDQQRLAQLLEEWTTLAGLVTTIPPDSPAKGGA